MKNLIEKIKGQKVLVIGDIMLDVYLRGRATRISPEAPVPVVLAENKELIPGGAANVMANLKALGCDVYGAGLIGKDSEGEFLVDHLHALGVNTDCILQTLLPTIYKTRILASGQHVIRYDCDSDFSQLNCQEDFIDIVRSLLDTDDFGVIIISDYNKGTISLRLMNVIKTLCKCPVICDIKPGHANFFNGVQCITPNLSEARSILGITHGCSAVFLARRLKTEMSLSSVIITMSDDGLLLLDEQDEGFIWEAYTKVDEHDPRHRFDVTGAGDTVLSVFSAGVAAGFDSGFAAFVANVAAGIVVNKIGTAVCTFDELDRELKTCVLDDRFTA